MSGDHGKQLDDEVRRQIEAQLSDDDDEESSGSDSSFSPNLPNPNAQQPRKQATPSKYLDLEAAQEGAESYNDVRDEADYSDADDLPDLDDEQPADPSAPSPLALSNQHFLKNGEKNIERWRNASAALKRVMPDDDSQDLSDDALEKEKRRIRGDEESDDNEASESGDSAKKVPGSSTKSDAPHTDAGPRDNKDKVHAQEHDQGKEKPQHKSTEDADCKETEKNKRDKERKRKEAGEIERKENAEKEKKLKEQLERKKKEDRERKLNEQKQRKEKADKERRMKEEQERKDKKEKEQKLKEERERKAKEEKAEKEQKRKEKEEKERKEKEEKERKEKEEKERKEKEREEKEREEKERKEKEEKERKEKEDMERKKKEDRERKEKEKKEQKEKADRKRREKEKEEEERKKEEEKQRDHDSEQQHPTKDDTDPSSTIKIDRKKQIAKITKKVIACLGDRLDDDRQFIVEYFCKAAYNLAVDVHVNKGNTSRSKALRETTDHLLKTISDPTGDIDGLVSEIEKGPKQLQERPHIVRLLTLWQSTHGPVRFTKALKAPKPCKCMVTGQDIRTGDLAVFAVCAMGPSNKNVRFLPLLPEAVRLCNGEFRRPTAEESEDYEPPRDSDADQESSISSASSLRDSELPESLRTLETEENEPQSSCSDEDAMSQDEDVMDCDSDIDDDDEDDEEESEEMEESQRDLLIFTIRDPNMFVKLRPACNLKENNKNYSIMQPKDSESALKFFNQEGLIDVDDRWAVSIAKALIAKLFKVRQGTGEDLDAIVADDDGDLGTVLSETDDCIVVTPRATEDVVEKLADYDYCADDISFIYSRDEEPLKAHHELVSQWLDWLKEKKVYNDKESTAFLKKLFAEPKFENVSHPKTVAAARFLPRLFNSLTSS